MFKNSSIALQCVHYLSDFDVKKLHQFSNLLSDYGDLNKFSINYSSIARTAIYATIYKNYDEFYLEAIQKLDGLLKESGVHTINFAKAIIDDALEYVLEKEKIRIDALKDMAIFKK